MLISVVLKMTNYIAHPFWPARNICIEIEKKSGVNRQRSEDKRESALRAECKKQGYACEQYQNFRREAAEQWYKKADGKIYIPRHQLAGGLVQAIGCSPKNLRGIFDSDNFRALIHLGDFTTDRTEADGVFSRFVKLEGSNQRSFQENEYIGCYLDEGEPFYASGKIDLPDEKQADTVKRIFEKTIESIGIGAARKMGFGRGSISSWEIKAT